jgi:Fe2+ transport system protein FeoA
MKDLQKMLKEGEKSTRVKEAKQRFEVCQKLLEQGIRQSGKAKMEEREQLRLPKGQKVLSAGHSLLEFSAPIQVEVRATRISDDETLRIKVDQLQQKLDAKTRQLRSDEAEL